LRPVIAVPATAVTAPGAFQLTYRIDGALVRAATFTA
jgi:hypothetical protein